MKNRSGGLRFLALCLVLASGCTPNAKTPPSQLPADSQPNPLGAQAATNQKAIEKDITGTWANDKLQMQVTKESADAYVCRTKFGTGTFRKQGTDYVRTETFPGGVTATHIMRLQDNRIVIETTHQSAAEGERHFVETFMRVENGEKQETNGVAQRPSPATPEVQKYPTEQIFVYEEEYNPRTTQLPFYTGPTPLKYKNGRWPLLGGIGGSGRMYDVYHDFGSWRNSFIYSKVSLQEAGIADGSITIDRTVKSNGKYYKVLAEARLSKVISSNEIEIEEYHYGPDGKVSFYCKSRIEIPTGIKKSESEVRGKKQRDYYFIWPART